MAIDLGEPMAFRELLIGGRWVAPADGSIVEATSPHDGRVLGTVATAGSADVDAAVDAARNAFDRGPWPATPPSERADLVRRLADRYATSLEEMAQLISSENGSPISFSRLGQTGAVPMLFDGFLAAAEHTDWDEDVAGAFGTTTIVREPVGVVAAITAWNVPQILIVAKLVPALLAGCTIVIKASPDAPLDAMVLASMVEEVGFPPGVVSIIVGGSETGRHLVGHPGVDKVAFTGSTAVGREIAATAATSFKRVSLELGGKSAAIVLDDADLARTAGGLRFASYMNNGQACAAQTRVLAPSWRYDEVVDALEAAVSTFVVGDPLDESSEIGPLVNERQRDRVLDYLRAGVDEGATPVVGGPRASVPDGCYIAPTLFRGVHNGMRIAREEIFGPVVAVIPYDDEDGAVRIANDSPYGLGGSVWTADRSRGESVARRVRTGMVGVNTFGPAPDMPFGGFKGSGIGREYGAHGLAAYVELKAIHGHRR